MVRIKNESNSAVGKFVVCDDQQAVRTILSLLLQPTGVDVITCGDGEELLQILDEEEVQGVFLDIGLGEKDGIEVLREIRSLSGETARTPVCMLSGLAHQEQKALQEGATSFLQKPVEASELRDTAQNLVRASAA